MYLLLFLNIFLKCSLAFNVTSERLLILYPALVILGGSFFCFNVFFRTFWMNNARKGWRLKFKSIRKLCAFVDWAASITSVFFSLSFHQAGINVSYLPLCRQASFYLLVVFSLFGQNTTNKRGMSCPWYSNAAAAPPSLHQIWRFGGISPQARRLMRGHGNF